MKLIVYNDIITSAKNYYLRNKKILYIILFADKERIDEFGFFFFLEYNIITSHIETILFLLSVFPKRFRSRYLTLTRKYRKNVPFLQWIQSGLRRGKKYCVHYATQWIITSQQPLKSTPVIYVFTEYNALCIWRIQ